MTGKYIYTFFLQSNVYIFIRLYRESKKAKQNKLKPYVYIKKMRMGIPHKWPESKTIKKKQHDKKIYILKYGETFTWLRSKSEK